MSCRFFVAFALSVLFAGSGSSAADPSSLELSIASFLEAQAQSHIDFRRDLHRHPELSGQERLTARRIAERLEAAGLELRTGVGGHGLVALLRGRDGGPVVGYRSDMDAVRSGAPDPAAFPSEVPGVRHLCGHDVHTTVGLAVAEALAAHRDHFDGTVIFVFQGAEESAAGARAMLADEAFRDADPEVVFALHTSPLPAGTIGLVKGPTLAGRDRVSFEASADSQIEPILAALSAAATHPTPASWAALQEIPLTRTLCVFSPPSVSGRRVSAVLNFGSEAGRQACKQRVLDALVDLGSIAVDWTDRWISGVYSSPQAFRTARRAIRRSLGKEAFVKSGGAPPVFSEDFGFFLEGRKGAMFWLGVGASGLPHSPGYEADDSSILPAAKAMAFVLLEVLDTGS